MDCAPTPTPDDPAAIERWTRSPHHAPLPAPGAAPAADDLLRLGCLTYGDDDPARFDAARAMLDAAPGLATASIWAMAATGEAVAAAELLAVEPAAASASGGPFDWPPLLYATYARIPATDTMPVVELLLAHGADPNTGFLWEGLVPPFTALTGALGGGEQHQPPHPRSIELAELLLAAGADANDGQALYNRGPGDLALDDTEWLELLLRHGLGTGDGGSWRARLAPLLPAPAAHLAEALQHAAEHGLLARVRLLLAHGGDPNGRGLHPLYRGRTAYQGAVSNGWRDVADVLERSGGDATSVGVPERLFGALLGGHTDLVEPLLTTNPGLLTQLRATHPTMIRRAAELGHAEGIRTLHGLGFEVDALDRCTALHEAALRGRDDLVELLLSLGADPTIHDRSFDAPPAGWAAHFGHHATAERLTVAADAWNDRPDDG